MDKSPQVIDPLPAMVIEAIDAYGRYYAEQHNLGMSVRDDMKYIASVAIRSVAIPDTGLPSPDQLIKIDDGQSTHARTAKEWLDLARADLASRSASAPETRQITDAEIIGWADGIRAAFGTEFSSRITPTEAALSDAILKVNAAPVSASAPEIQPSTGETVCPACGEFSNTAKDQKIDQLEREVSYWRTNAETMDRHNSGLRAQIAATVSATQQREPDGYAVLLDDKASAPKGYWFVGCYTTKETAADVVMKGKQGGMVVPVYFETPRSTTQPRNQCDGCARGLPVVNGMHDLTGTAGSYPNESMVCTADRYTVSATQPTCSNCDTPVPPGCEGQFKNDGIACFLNRPIDTGK